MQREEDLERLRKKIENLLIQDSTTVQSNAGVNLLLKDLLEVQTLVKRLYPNNETLKTILSNQDLFREQGIAHTATTKAEMIIDCAKKIALVIDLDPSDNNDTNRIELPNNTRKKDTMVSNSSESLPPKITAEEIEKIGIQKTNMNAFSTFILAILAGAFIALGGIYFTFATSQMTLTIPFTQILGGLVFSFGLILVVVTGAALFTGNNLAVMGLVSKKIKASQLAKNWVIVYVGNFIGSVATAGVLYMSNAWTNNDYHFGIRALMIASHKVSLSFVEAFFLGILCNSLVCIAIWLAASGKKVSDKILAIIFPVSAFVAMGFEHSVANMYFLSFAFMIKNDTMLLSAIKTAGITVNTSNIDVMGIFGNLLPVTLGNIVGGSIFVGLVYWLAYLRNNRTEN